MKITEGKEWMPQTKQEQNTIQFNYFRDAELINVKYRDGAKRFKMVSGAEKIFYNIDAIKYSKEVIICEGEIDVLSFVNIGIHHAISVPNGSVIGNVNLEYLDNCIDYFENKTKIILALDKDAAGQNTQKEMIRRFGSDRCFTVDFKDCKDANEYLQKYGDNALRLVIENAQEVPIDGVSSVKDFQEQFEHYLINGMQSGFKTGKTHFDKVFSTYTGQYIVVTGIPSSGKSDWVDEMCIGYADKNDWKIAFASPENKPNQIHAAKLISKLTGKWIRDVKDFKTEWYDLALNYLNDKFKFIDLDEHFDLNLVLEKAQRLIFKFGIKCLVIDPYNKVRLNASLSKNINEYTNDYLIKIDEFARKHDILIILVAHPRKPNLNEAKTYEPSFYDIKGGGEFYDMSPHGILVHRDYANDVTKIKILKVKFSHLGTNNAEVYYRWNFNNGRYMEFENGDASVELLECPIINNENPFNVSYLTPTIIKDIEPNYDFDLTETDEIPF
jgi:twinkle protein